MKRIAIIGFGRFGARLFEQFRKHSQVEYVCGRSTNKKLLDLQKEFKVKISDNFESILNEIDLAVIATPADTHFSIAKACLMQKKDIFVEKPLCSSADEAREILELAEKNNCRLYVDDVSLYHAGYQELKKNIAGKMIESVRFSWKKYGTFEDTILNNLVYHHMYILADLLGEGNEPRSLNITKAETDILEMKFNYGSAAVGASYNRRSDVAENIMEISVKGDKNPYTWKNDQVGRALADMVSGVANDNADYQKNNRLALTSLQHLEIIKKAMPV